MTLHRLALLPAAILALGLAACASHPDGDAAEPATDAPPAATAPGTEAAPAPDAPAQAACNPDAARSLVGQAGTEAVAEQARAAAGAKAVRMLKPGQPATMDFRGDRLNVMLDDAGNVAELHCG